MEQIDEKLKRTKVTAPTDGTVLTVPVTEGQVIIAAASVNSGTTLMTIANLSSCSCRRTSTRWMSPGSS